jgi:hypothetical protein
MVAVMLSLANRHSRLPVAYRLYLPKEWAENGERRRKAGVPDDITFATKTDIALAQVRWACEAGAPRGVVLMDAGYGASTELRRSMTALGLTYVAGILPNTTVWTSDAEPLPAKRWSGRGRPPKLMRRDAKHQPISVKELALNLTSSAWRKVTWREGAAAPLSSRFARVRVRVAHRDYRLSERLPEEWLLVEWPKGEKEPTKYWPFNSCGRHQLSSTGRLRQAALAYRTRLYRTQAGGWAWRLRRARMARVPPSRHDLNRGLWLLDLREGELFPPQHQLPKFSSRNLPFPKVIDPEDPPLRPERHVPNSIATLRRRLIVKLVANLSRCPCCAAQNSVITQRPMSAPQPASEFAEAASHKLGPS